MELLSFQRCQTISKESKKKQHLLLGNGFSIACRPDIFTYGNLFSKARPNFSIQLEKAFSTLNTKDFEVVMRSLKSAASLSVIYDSVNSYRDEMLSDCELLKKILVSSIASSHPVQPSDITEEEFTNCRKFISLFEHTYTLNYDLLLYWTLMHDDIKNTSKIKHDDGFRTPNDGKCDYVTWEVNNTTQQNIYYLHGALHLFDAGNELQKFTWVNTGIKLTEQIKTALDKDFFPLFVSEGTSIEKKDKINHSGYLTRGLRSFSSISGNLFIYGHSLDDNDDHIIGLISQSKINNLFISLYGDPMSEGNKKIILKAENIVLERKRINQNKKSGQIELSLHFYDSKTASIWR